VKITQHNKIRGNAGKIVLYVLAIEKKKGLKSII
jgi:hypothetical protein